MRQFFLLAPLLLLLGCSGKTEVVTHYPDGMIKSKGYFDAHGKKHGEWTEWTEDGFIDQKRTWHHGNPRDGRFVFWYKKGYKKSEGRYVNGEKSGRWRYWHYFVSPEIMLEYGQWKLDVFNRLVERQGYYNHGKKDGTWTFYSSWGAKTTRTYENNIMIRSCDYYDNDQAEEEVEYDSNGNKHGPYKRWYEDGEMKETGTYKNGNRDGYWIYNDRDAGRLDEALFHDGVIDPNFD